MIFFRKKKKPAPSAPPPASPREKKAESIPHPSTSQRRVLTAEGWRRKTSKKSFKK